MELGEQNWEALKISKKNDGNTKIPKKLNTTRHPTHWPQMKRIGPSKMHVESYRWLYENSIPKAVCHHFWLGLIPLPKIICIGITSCVN